MTSIASTVAAGRQRGPHRPFGANDIRRADAEEALHAFLSAAAGEGLVLDGVDAADLYIDIFPERYAAAIATPQRTTR